MVEQRLFPPARGAMSDPDTLELYYGTLLDSMADGVLSVSPDHRIEVLNRTGAAILGCDPGNVVGSTLLEAFLDNEAADEFVDAVLAPIAKGTGAKGTDPKGDRPQGDRHRQDSSCIQPARRSAPAFRGQHELSRARRSARRRSWRGRHLW